MIDLDAIKARFQAATADDELRSEWYAAADKTDFHQVDNAISHAIDDITSLIAEVERLRIHNMQLTALLDRVLTAHGDTA